MTVVRYCPWCNRVQARWRHRCRHCREETGRYETPTSAMRWIAYAILGIEVVSFIVYAAADIWFGLPFIYFLVWLAFATVCYIICKILITVDTKRVGREILEGMIPPSFD